ncbi:MAG: sulfur carrier protein ThiS [Mycobacteriales bacterium]
MTTFSLKTSQRASTLGEREPAVQITFNGLPRELAEQTSVAGLVSDVLTDTAGIAVAVNATVVPRSTWATTELRPGDRVEVLTAAPGG